MLLSRAESPNRGPQSFQTFTERRAKTPHASLRRHSLVLRFLKHRVRTNTANARRLRTYSYAHQGGLLMHAHSCIWCSLLLFLRYNLA